jgi:hypothetical protein
MATPEQADQSSPERRKFIRHQVAIPIEMLPEGASVAGRTQTSEVSLGGCYVEMIQTMQVGTKLHLGLWVKDEKITTDAEVVTHHPGFGNGMKFLNMSSGDEGHLKRFLESLPKDE